MIYSNHIKECNEYAQASPANLKRACQFVLATIQQQLETVPVALTDIAELAEGSRFAWGVKKKGVEYIEANYEQLFFAANSCRHSPNILMGVFLGIPGMALVKAGFLCQIFAGSVGCIDTHNVKLYNIPLNVLRYRYEGSDANKAAKVKRYVELCAGLGGAHFLWSRWCDYVASVRPFNWTDGEEVSQFHVDVITGREDGTIADLFTGLEYEPTFRQEPPRDTEYRVCVCNRIPCECESNEI